MCINANGLGPDGPRIVFGQIYGVLTESNPDGCGLCYALTEFGEDIYFRADRFVPLSDINEEEMEREYKILTHEHS